MHKQEGQVTDNDRINVQDCDKCTVDTCVYKSLSSEWLFSSYTENLILQRLQLEVIVENIMSHRKIIPFLSMFGRFIVDILNFFHVSH